MHCLLNTTCNRERKKYYHGATYIVMYVVCSNLQLHYIVYLRITGNSWDISWHNKINSPQCSIFHLTANISQFTKLFCGFTFHVPIHEIIWGLTSLTLSLLITYQRVVEDLNMLITMYIVPKERFFRIIRKMLPRLLMVVIRSWKIWPYERFHDNHPSRKGYLFLYG